MKPVGICAIIRDEEKYIAEWIEFHRLVGVSRFVLYDDRSEDGTLDVIEEHNRGDIAVYPYSKGWHDQRYYGPSGSCCGFYRVPQCCAYNHYGTVYSQVGWTAFIDVDEYLYHTSYLSLPEALEPYENCSGVMVNWLVFGSGGHPTCPRQLTIEAYQTRGRVGEPKPYGAHTKAIVNTMLEHAIWGEQGSHYPRLRRLPVDQKLVNSECAFLMQPTDFGIVLNHYYCRSYEEMVAKAMRDDRNAPPGYQPGLERLRMHDLNDVLDQRILHYAPELRGRL